MQPLIDCYGKTKKETVGVSTETREAGNEAVKRRTDKDMAGKKPGDISGARSCSTKRTKRDFTPASVTL